MVGITTKNECFFLTETVNKCMFSWAYSQGKNIFKWNSSPYEKYKYGHLGSWYITLNEVVLRCSYNQIKFSKE